MIQLIVGNKGKGKTKCLLDKVNDKVKEVSGSIVFLDRSTKHMYELNNKVRLIGVSDYMITNSNEFVGFLAGILSQDHDLEEMYFDNFMECAGMEDSDLVPVMDKLEIMSDKFKVDFVISISRNEKQIPDSMKSNIIVSL